MTCPHCGSSDVRHSHSLHWSDGWHRALGREAYRCRKCRLRFFLPRMSQIFAHATGQSVRSRKATKRLDLRGRKRLIRRLIAITVFVLMFSLFGLFLHRITEDRTPASSSQGTDSSDQ